MAKLCIVRSELSLLRRLTAQWAATDQRYVTIKYPHELVLTLRGHMSARSQTRLSDCKCTVKASREREVNTVTRSKTINIFQRQSAFWGWKDLTEALWAEHANCRGGFERWIGRWYLNSDSYSSCPHAYPTNNAYNARVNTSSPDTTMHNHTNLQVKWRDTALFERCKCWVVLLDFGALWSNSMTQGHQKSVTWR